MLGDLDNAVISFSKRIRKMDWRSCGFNGEDNPFLKSNAKRKLLITIDDKNLVGVSGSEKDALEFLCDLKDHQLLDMYGVEDQSFPRVRIRDEISTHKRFKVKVEFADPDKWIKTFIHDLPSVSQQIDLLNNCLSDNIFNEEQIKDGVLLFFAHRALSRDLFVSLPLFAEVLSDGNCDSFALSPQEVLKVIGLILRSRDDFTLYCKNGSIVTHRHDFYWILSQIYLKNIRSMWGMDRFKQEKQHKINSLISAAIARTARAFQSRDNLAIQYFADKDFDLELYFLDYLSLLVSGTIDAIARIVHFSCSLTGNVNGVGFRRKQFIKNLNNTSHNSLKDVINDNEFNAIITILGEYRNHIHEAELIKTSINNERTLLRLNKETADKVIEASISLDNIDDWGIIDREGVYLSPFEFGCTLLDTGISIVDRIARALVLDLNLKIEPESMDNRPDWAWEKERIFHFG